MLNSISCYTKKCFDFTSLAETKSSAGALKVAACFALVAAAFLSVAYGVFCLARRIIVGFTPKSIDEQLQDLFASARKVQKIFTFGETRVGIIYNPNGPAFQLERVTFSSPVLLVSSSEIPEEVVATIKNKIPENATYCCACTRTMNGKPVFKAFGF